ncbi:nucleocapsid protein [Wigeon coronavirus HKU20]|uniref:Nucleocapsid protein n=1 Tax=Wigeon coronavirus HKU20 TaxID=1159908 RepID=H9BR29_9NIDO|nr:nucleocapsid protein [Wigeon coronavirus HKU20]AFD29238.1 nucleocapsid protein [Wigeon coronavirus HKU20]
MAVPSVPKADCSWFQIIKAQNKKVQPLAFKGDGVPINTTLPKEMCHGYWLRYKRVKPGGAPLPPSYSFYYTGTGPRATLKYGELQDSDNQDNVNRVLWVKSPDADTSIKPKVAKRNPDKHPLLPLRFKPGDGPVQGFRIDPFQSRGRSVERGQQDRRAQSAEPQRPKQRERSRSAPSRAAPKQHAIPKRVLLKGKTISGTFGKRSPAKANVGSPDTEKTGLGDPRLMALMRFVPGTQELLFAGHLKHKMQPEGVQLTFTYDITVKRDNKDFDRIVEALNSVVDMVYEPEGEIRKDQQSKKDTQPKKKAEKKTPTNPQKQPDKPVATIVDNGDSQVINWGTDPAEGLESFS